MTNNYVFATKILPPIFALILALMSSVLIVS